MCLQGQKRQALPWLFKKFFVVHTKTKWTQSDISERKEFQQEDLVHVPFPQDNITVYVKLQGVIPCSNNLNIYIDSKKISHLTV